MDKSLELLMKMDIQNPETVRYKVKRLSQLCGEDVIFTLKELPYARVEELRSIIDDSSVHITLAGVDEPDLKATELLQKYGAITPIELIKKLLRPGEIEDISREIEKLCGFRTNTLEAVEDIKKK